MNALLILVGCFERLAYTQSIHDEMCYKPRSSTFNTTIGTKKGYEKNCMQLRYRQIVSIYEKVTRIFCYFDFYSKINKYFMLCTMFLLPCEFDFIFFGKFDSTLTLI